eukprot:5432757-Karenia_brevis.AAC.1
MDTMGQSTTIAAEVTLVYMQESLFLMPEAFDDALLDEVAPDLQNPEIVCVAGDLDDVVLDEDEAVAILANYGQ